MTCPLTPYSRFYRSSSMNVVCECGYIVGPCLQLVCNSSIGRLLVVEFVFLQPNFITEEKLWPFSGQIRFLDAKQILRFYAKLVWCLCPLLFLYLPLSMCVGVCVCVGVATPGCYRLNRVWSCWQSLWLILGCVLMQVSIFYVSKWLCMCTFMRVHVCVFCRVLAVLSLF